MSRCFYCSKHFWNSSSGTLFGMVVACPRMSILSENLWPYIAESRMRSNLAIISDGTIWISSFWPKTPGQRTFQEQVNCRDARSKHQGKGQDLSHEQPHVSLTIFPFNNAASLLDHLQQIQSELCPCDPHKKSALSSHSSWHACLSRSQWHIEPPLFFGQYKTNFQYGSY